ncbi:lipase/acyltransferase domain-containing protein [Streptomyces sp. RKAG337]|uniref:lipase/acyltransferase domain-containing protein n=1 Tax=Streptomyces sp. RKAG337 TaxID=2893404 RepID=UPI00203453FA|nr:alpha/beta fold hydrolase [Streptomyces sp. RKAG337]MCM2424909.1 alpha/beta fold hydrolase [Streptomyces sp. RKAG337]
MKSLGGIGSSRARSDATHDAVLVIPGIMGTRLVEAATGKVLWGMGKAAEYAGRWDLEGGMDALALSPAEREGEFGRVVPRGIIRTPSWAPLLGGVEPYDRLLKRLRNVVVHPDAIAEFGYDWRLPTEYNAQRLAQAVECHLAAWREHPQSRAARAFVPDGRPAGVVLIAHSMGGLVAAAASLIPGAMADVRAVLTLGSPFHGAVKAVQVLSEGRGLPGLPKENLRRLARTLPGIHDLLPSYRCLVVDDDVVALDAAAVESVGGDRELAQRSFDLHARLRTAVLPGHRIIQGTTQQTLQSLRISAGVAEFLSVGFSRHSDDTLVRHPGTGVPVMKDHKGDGTVFRYATSHGKVPTIAVAQQHTALPRTGSVIDIACGMLTGAAHDGSHLAGDELGLEVPDQVDVGVPFDILAQTRRHRNVTFTVEDPYAISPSRARMMGSSMARVRGQEDQWSARITLTSPGLYRVGASSGSDPVTRLVMAV